MAAVDISESNNVDRLILFIAQAAAVSWADMKEPDTTVASQSLRKVGFCKARQLEVAVIWSERISLQKYTNSIPRLLPPRSYYSITMIGPPYDWRGGAANALVRRG
ncbi:MAG TPA: hypothetical protein VN939_02720, partial [Chthoniobacterales bacterium]|nr:hypothetical protein [Chthoniobacterales bacterium]